jgi:hypothetical protein
MVILGTEQPGGVTSRSSTLLSSRGSTTAWPVTISQDPNERALRTASICSSTPSRAHPPARLILAWQVRAARVVERPVRRSAPRMARR